MASFICQLIYTEPLNLKLIESSIPLPIATDHCTRNMSSIPPAWLINIMIGTGLLESLLLLFTNKIVGVASDSAAHGQDVTSPFE